MSATLSDQLPSAWRASVLAALQSEETLLAWLELDLTTSLQFGTGLLVLTSQRLLASDNGTQWQAWPLQAALRLQRFDHAGIGTLTLGSATGRIAHWRYTLARATVVKQLADAFTAQITSLTSGTPRVTSPDVLCPRCQTLLNPGQEGCPTCARNLQAPPSTLTLLRLWRFAQPYRWQLLAGFLLMMGGTAATLIPPYLTMPLMDEVLIPYQNGVPIDPQKISLYLGGLGLAAIFAWAMSWAKTYILALVSERIGADLRTTTYEHLLKLSLEYFGAKRTGDLMSRIGSESDRICVFLSLHLLDFATDVLMIGMTALVLFSINPWLAVVTLLPLPFIAWMIHLVRNRLRYGFEQIDRVWSEVTSVLADTIPGVRVVKAFAQEKRESERFREANAHNLVVN
ncbi:MAG: ABC transporter ATP-binding protein, partial [Rugosibacter sp.]